MQTSTKLLFFVCSVAVGGCSETSNDPASPKAGCEYVAVDLEKYGSGPFQGAPEIVSSNGVLETTLTVGYAEHEIAGCPTRLRNYNGNLVGPTLRVKPGDTLRILVKNDLPANPAHSGDHNVPHDFNTTNLHTHGLWVSPEGVSDNVLLKIEPGSEQQYIIDVPLDHAPGTFWYHAHVHGSTAIQVNSGMAGALIIEGGLDDVAGVVEAEDKIFLFQHLLYDEQGEVEEFDKISGPTIWRESLRQPTVNGQVLPVINMRPGEVQRWRFIHGGVHETILASLEGHDLHEVALDGLALGRINTWNQVELQPGYRVDVLVKAQPLAPGESEHRYFLVDQPSDASDSLQLDDETSRRLAEIVVSGEPIDMVLPDEALLAPLLPHATILEAELTGTPQSAVYDISLGKCETPGEPCTPCTEDEEGCAFRFTINGREFSDSYVRELKLGTASEWTVSSLLANHPYHIHVNPFEVTREGPDGAPEKVFKDTFLVKKSAGEVKIRSRYERYTGKFVMHCHILDHEDRGMMEIVEVVP